MVLKALPGRVGGEKGLPGKRQLFTRGMFRLEVALRFYFGLFANRRAWRWVQIPWKRRFESVRIGGAQTDHWGFFEVARSRGRGVPRHLLRTGRGLEHAAPSCVG